MSQVLARAQTPEQKARARFLHEGWQRVRRTMAVRLEQVGYAQRGLPEGWKKQQIFLSRFESDRPTGARDLKPNHDWRTGGMPKGWSYWQRANSHAKFAWDRAAGDPGSESLRIDATGSEGQPLAFVRTATVEPDSLYHARCRIRTSGVDAGSAIGITITWKDKDGKWVRTVPSTSGLLKQPTRDGWQTIDMYRRTPQIEQPQLVFLLSVDGADKGRIWFDDAELNRVIEPKQ